MPSETATVQTDSAAPAVPSVPDTLLQDLQSGAKNMMDLDGPTRKIAMDRIKSELTQADTAAADPAPPIEVKPVEPPAETPKAPESTPKPEGKDLQAPMDPKERRKFNQKLADDANTAEQKTAALLARQERARKALEDAQKAEVKLPDDVWDKSHQDTLATEVQTLKKQLEFLTKGMVDKDQEELDIATKDAQTAREKTLFANFDTLQDEYEPLKTTKPFKDLNSLYANWLDSELVQKSGLRATMPDATLDELRRAATEKYNKDPEFQKAVSPNPISAEDAPRFNTLLSLHHETASIGGTLEGNWLARLKREGTLEEVMQKGRKEAAVEAAQRTVQAIQKANTAVQPVAPGDGATRGYMDNEWTTQRAAGVQAGLVKKHQSGQALTPAERETLKKVTAFLTNDFVGAAQ